MRNKQWRFSVLVEVPEVMPYEAVRAMADKVLQSSEYFEAVQIIDVEKAQQAQVK